MYLGALVIVTTLTDRLENRKRQGEICAESSPQGAKAQPPRVQMSGNSPRSAARTLAGRARGVVSMQTRGVRYVYNKGCIRYLSWGRKKSALRAINV